MATSARHVVGLHEPPRNTSGALLSLQVASARVPASASNVGPTASVASQCRALASGEKLMRKRFKSATSTQNWPKVKPFIWLESAVLPLRLASALAVFSISLTGNNNR